MKKYLLIIVICFIFNTNVKANTIDDIVDLKSSVSELENNMFLKNHPIGSIYETTNPKESTVEKMHELYGGTWEVYGENRVLRGTTTTAGETGGNNEISLSTSQIPTLSVSGTKAAQTIRSTSTGSGYSVGYTSATRKTSTNGNHSHSYTNGGEALVVGSYANAGGISNDQGFKNLNNAGIYYGWKKQISAIAAAGNHYHSASDYYVVNAKISGVQNHAHNITVGAQSITSAYTNNNKSNVNILDSYITVYRYKRKA